MDESLPNNGIGVNLYGTGHGRSRACAALAKTYECRILDIGMGGLKVQTDVELTAGAEIIVSDPLAGELSGEIVWTSGDTASVRLDHDEMVPTFVISNIVQEDLPGHITRRPKQYMGGILAWLTWPFRRAESR